MEPKELARYSYGRVGNIQQHSYFNQLLFISWILLDKPGVIPELFYNGWWRPQHSNNNMNPTSTNVGPVTYLRTYLSSYLLNSKTSFR